MNDENLPLAVHILGVNAAGHEAENAAICAGRQLPWLQDTPEQNCWAAWGVEWRDVVVLDTENHVLEVYNLTGHYLDDPANYNALKAILVAAASAPPR